MSRETCRECTKDTDEPVVVALEHVASLAGRLVYLCPACRFAFGLVPLDEHPAGTLGFPRYEDGIPVNERQWGTAWPGPGSGPSAAP